MVTTLKQKRWVVGDLPKRSWLALVVAEDEDADAKEERNPKMLFKTLAPQNSCSLLLFFLLILLLVVSRCFSWVVIVIVD